MPAVDFSRGRPRNGQWVLVDGKFVGICQGPATKQHTVVEDPMNGQMRVTALPPQGAVLVPIDAANLFQVDLVDDTGMRTTGQFFISVKRLTPITKREQIPSVRLGTYLPNWQPVA